ncbi:hypothetical protein G1K75_12260 [Tenacibaculum finnmarkense]|uniref:hypothetical protein n=1 Tax=Tenacibaculum finnmarkense TaxID=2781243 RepID=UPI001EFC283D|nr:hypothetical protein [Tenacibaculum finnmarkense]MCG8806424.1 hypothetical protein [Tenacibaculum finnmarkense]MCG8857536.1 hypothetical protein [Tenacibaculum finnmarkense]WCC43733.1 hypothetical protein PJW08_00260 [Tenacibaculum finnmarkense]
MMFNLFKKIKFNSDILSFINSELDNINWFSNIDKPNDLSINNFNIKKIEEKVIRILSSKKDYKNYVGLHNLLLEAENRSSAYLFNNKRKKYNDEWNKLANKINSEIDFNRIKDIEDSFNQLNKTNIDLLLPYVIRGYVRDLYFKENDNTYPSFFKDIIDIYKKGHIIVGWENRFKFKENLKTNPISKEEGTLLIW